MSHTLNQEKFDFHLISENAYPDYYERSIDSAEKYHLPIALEWPRGMPLKDALRSPNLYTIEKLNGLMAIEGNQPIAQPSDYDSIVQRGIAIVPCLTNFPMSFTSYALEYLMALKIRISLTKSAKNRPIFT